ncbi:hypothetical protein GCM10020358_78410 [Amorphoplanes nipponensis]|uniref:RICIN domain-containing protein n=1 Tax=Actinoplanes nipponensis TaxID=135950 RepID=A0A919JL23_9ACTN|nr:hypothetical protein [Actinoplanes nipponensis]GIE52783.1 hypothetical protein Ani05nite_63170 [Actinoplanes nipponensis]
MRSHRATVLAAVLAAGLVLTQQACNPVERQSGEPVAFTTPTPRNTPSGGTPSAGGAASGGTASSGAGRKSAAGRTADPILAGRRQVVIRPVRSAESIVVVGERGRLTLTDGEAGRGLFLLLPAGDKHQIRTARAGGGPACLSVRSNSSGPLTVEAAACDSGRAGQLFTITRQPERTADGNPTYAISNRGAFLQVSAGGGLIAEELGDAPLRTTYEFVDNGAA